MEPIIASAVRELRIKRGLTQEQLAEMAGLDRKTINRIENGHFQPTLETFVALTKALGTSSTKLLGS